MEHAHSSFHRLTLPKLLDWKTLGQQCANRGHLADRTKGKYKTEGHCQNDNTAPIDSVKSENIWLGGPNSNGNLGTNKMQSKCRMNP